MPLEPSKESFLHTLKAFWTGKRFLKLFTFALILGNITFYCVWMLAKRQVVNNAVSHHNKIYSTYLRAVDQVRRNSEVKAPADSQTQVVDAEAVTDAPSPATLNVAGSPYWVALRNVRHQFSSYRLNVILQGSVDGEREKKILDILKNRSHDWTFSDTQDGWARSFYVLPTKNTAAFQIVSDVRDDLVAWETTASVMGGYAFILLFAFGWFWTRALDEASVVGPTQTGTEVRAKVSGLQSTASEVSAVLDALYSELATVETQLSSADPDVVRSIDDMVAQIRLLAVNGSIESARSADAYRVFHVLMHEINQLASHSRELLKTVKADGQAFINVRRRIDALQSRVNGVEASGQPRSSGVTAFRRVG